MVAALILLATFSPVSAHSQGQDSIAAVAGWAKLHVRVEVAESSYHSGDAVYVRVKLRNNSGEPINLPRMDAANLTELRIVDPSGRELEQMSPGTIGLSLGIFTLKPGQEATLSNFQGQEWVSLADFGYNLRRPGTYTIIGVLRTGQPHAKNSLESLRSGGVQLTIKG
jgi:hypothetical protein